ncbi:chemoreceptor glutamine deamidase CheD [Candidatus Woesearchaeota archaeon]|nr:chemoreceptor glutamine deamidase CheD [Candidatus Woesearchaeota archaeon]
MSSLTALQPCIQGFESIGRRWNEKERITEAKILPGEFYVTGKNERILTVLGSCIAVCVRDIKTGVGGMNHFMLPLISQERLNEESRAIIGTATRYGNFAMEHLINTILKNGGRRGFLEVKVFGGGRVMNAMTDVGQKNIDFIFKYLDSEGLRVIAKDVGDVHPRKVLYYPATGRARVKKIIDNTVERIVSRELVYKKTMDEISVEGEIELF